MKYTKVIIAYIVGLILLYFWYRTIDFEKFFYHLKQINFVYVIISGLFYALAYFIRSCRWKYLLNNIKIVSLSRMYLLFMTGLLINYIVPVRAGEVLKSYFLKKIENIRMSKSLPTVFLDKLMDLLPVIILIALLPFVKFSGTFVDTKVFYILIALISGILIVALLIIYYSSINKAFFTKLTHKFLFWYKGKLKSRFIEFVENFIESLHTIEKTWKNFGILFIYTLSCIIVEAIYVWCLFKAFGFSAPFFVIFFGYTLINLTYLFPTPPAGIGSIEVLWLLTFHSMFGFDKDLVNSVVAFNHVFTGTIIVIIGLLSFNILGISIASVFNVKMDEKTETNIVEEIDK